MDNRKKNGGVREGAGRPKKADKLKLIEKLEQRRRDQGYYSSVREARIDNM